MAGEGTAAPQLPRCTCHGLERCQGKPRCQMCDAREDQRSRIDGKSAEALSAAKAGGVDRTAVERGGLSSSQWLMDFMCFGRV